MKLDTIAMVTKGGCLFIGSVCGGLVAGLSQWANTDASPNTLEWTMIIAGCVGAGTSQMVSFLSSTFGTWRRERENGKPDPVPPTT